MNKHALKTWSEYMNMHAVNTCKQWLTYRWTCVLQVSHTRNTLDCTMMCAQDEEYAHEYLHGNKYWNISRSVVVYDAEILVFTWTENMEWIHEHACSEYMQTMVKEFMQMCTTIFNKNNDNIVCNNMCTWWWVCAWIHACKHFMEQQSFGCRRRCTYVGDCMHWKHGVNSWTRMHWKHGVNTWKWMQWIHASNGESVDAHVYYKFVIKETHSVQWFVHMMRSMRMNTCMGTINGTSVDRLSYTMQRYWYLHGLKTWSEYMNIHAVNTCKQWWKYSCKSVLQFFNKNNDNIVCNSMCTWWWVCAWILACKQFMEKCHGTTVVRLS